MKRKSGISLLMLVITIIILAILVSATATGTILAINNAKRVSFIQELKDLEDCIQTAIEEAKKDPDVVLPFKEEGLTRNELRQLCGYDWDEFSDNLSYASKYIAGDNDIKIIDMSKVSDKVSSRGILKDGNPKDIYIYPIETGKVLYVDGIEISGKKYFALSDELMQKDKVYSDRSTYGYSHSFYYSTEEQDTMIIHKNTEELTNELILELDAPNIKNSDYTYEMKLRSGNQRVEVNDGKIYLNTKEVKNSFGSNSFSGITELEIFQFDENHKYLRNGKVDIRNLDIITPYILEDDVTVTRTNGKLQVKIDNVSDESGIEAYYVDYLLKVKDGKTYIPNGTSIDKCDIVDNASGENVYEFDYGNIQGNNEEVRNYIVKHGQRSESNTITLDSDAYKIRILARDKAGNTSNFVDVNFMEQLVPEGFYYVGGNFENGMIISNNSNDINDGTSHYAAQEKLRGEQFVFIPVDGMEDLKTTIKFHTGAPVSDVKIKSTCPTEVKEKIVKAGGFYIGRYEGDYCNSFAYSDYGTTYQQAYDECKTKFSDKNNIVTLLPYGEMWDRVLAYIGEDGTDVLYGGTWGNTRKGSGYVTSQRNGSNPDWCKKHIYDLCGNISEWTQEVNVFSGSSQEYNVHRGGNYDKTVADFPVSARATEKKGETNFEIPISYRVAFYVVD